MSIQSEPNRVDASATKDFFIFMLTKDIDIIDAVADLVDNCVDGARRLRPSAAYEMLKVEIKVDSEFFSIEDNCGGIDIEVARDYAFRFGRPRNVKETPHSIGQFGVGMKRALFKLGNYFKIQSVAEHSKFVLEKNIQEWSNEEEWKFDFTEYEEQISCIPENERGTKIHVTDLRLGVKDSFSLENFRTKLILKLEAAHQSSIDQGLAISLNDYLLKGSPPELLRSNQIIPAYGQLKKENDKVTVKIYAGLSEREPEKAGWNVFCNGRLILEADTSPITGWGQGTGSPKYHNDFARFRGFIYFDSDEPSLLPWNTTKNSVDSDSPLYKAIRLEMISVMRPVISFLNRVADDERQLDDDLAPLEKVITDADYSPLSSITQETPFTVSIELPDLPKTSRISYLRLKSDIDKAKHLLNVKSNKEIGERTFDYFMKLECDDYE